MYTFYNIDISVEYIYLTYNNEKLQAENIS